MKDEMDQFQAFKTISIGGITKDQLIQKLLNAGVQFNPYAHLLFEHSAFQVSDQVLKLDLVKVSPQDLGITRACTFSEFVQTASKFGLKLCPLSLGAFLRLEYLEQKPGPYLHVASLKPEKSEEFPNGFYVRNNENIFWLRGYRASDDWEYSIDSEFVFLK